MTGDDFNALFDAARSHVFRLEAQQTYAIPADDASLQAFRSGSARPERSVHTSPWLRRIALTTAQGVKWSRVRVVEHPLSEYTRWELLAYVESQAVGERIDLTDQAVTAGPDFWLFDADAPGARAVLMHYSPEGELSGRELVTDPGTVAALVSRRNAAAAGSLRLNEFLARLGADFSAE